MTQPPTLADWLKTHDLEQYVDTFRDAGFQEVAELLDLEDTHFQEMGVKLAHRIRLRKALASLSAAGVAASTGTDSAASGGSMPSGDGGATSLPPPPPERALTLFISYGRDAFQDEARALAAALTERGHQVWFDQRELREGHAWQIDIGDTLAVLEGHTGPVSGAQVLPDGRLISWSWDNTLRLWDGASEAMLAVYPAREWITNTPFPCPWESLTEVVGACRTGDLWSGSWSHHIYLANRKAGWISRWHGEGLSTFGLAANTLIASTGRHMLFLELMRGGRPLD